MPWTIRDVDSHKRGLSAREKRQWVAVANSVLARCLADGGKEPECAAKAIRQANGVAGNEMAVHQTQINEYVIRSEQHQGHQNIIVPVIMMREGVHSGSHGPLFHPAEELGRFIQTWNGIPVVIQHPEREGVNVSANQPDIIDEQTVGRIYNAHMDGDKLCAEAWIDLERISEVSPETLAIIQAQGRLDVSVGVFSEDDLTPGNWNGEEYVGVARGHRPDHLALLPGGVGACSWADGCGVRANAEEGGTIPLGNKVVEEVDKVDEEEDDEEIEDAASCAGGDGKKKKKKKDVQADATADINDLPDSAFAYIESGGTKDDSGKTVPRSLRHFPVHDAAHARNALARMNQSPFGPRAKKKILAACKKFGIEVSSNALEVPDDNTELIQLFKDIGVEGYAAVQINADMGYRERMTKVQSVLDSMDNQTKVHFLQEVYDDAVVYEVMNRQGGPPVLYRQAYTINDKGEVTLTGVATPVVRQVSFVAASSPTVNSSDTGGKTMPEEKKPCCPEKVQALIASEHVPFEEADRAWLETLEMGQIDKLVAIERNAAVKPEPEPVKEPDVEPAPISNEQAVQVLREQLKTPEQFIQLLPEEMRDTMTSAYSLHKAERAKLIEVIKAAGVFTDDELKPRTMAELGKLAKMAKPHDYSGLSGGSPLNTNKIEDLLLPPGVVINQEGGK